jgi:aryl-alcohol dehydrogenase-like predicted oxidoreductase
VKYRKLGKTGIEVSEVGFGCWPIGGNKYGNSYGFVDDNESIKAVKKAVDLGCNYFDTADVYGLGHSEEILGRGILGSRDKCILATKVGNDFYDQKYALDFSPKYVRFALEKSLERLNTDYIDVYLLHNPSYTEIQNQEVFRVLADLKKEGKIRAAGVSVNNSREGIVAIVSELIDVVQIRVNFYHVGPVYDLFPVAVKNNIGIVAREPLGNGFLTGKYSAEDSFVQGDFRSEFLFDERDFRTRIADKLAAKLAIPGKRSMAQAAIRFALSHDAVSTAIPGAKTVKQTEENMAAGDTPELVQDDINSVLELLEQESNSD